MPSASELVYDRLIAAEKLKSGTKYERLAAVIFKVMDANADVVHQVVLRADDKQATHEIDVAVNVDGHERTTLIECRDRAKKVGEGEVRDFFGKLHHLRPDVAIMLSPTGFTDGAIKFADDEAIELAAFRPVENTDSWIKTIKIEAHLQIPGPVTVYEVVCADPDEQKRLGQMLSEGASLRADPWADVVDESGQPVGMLSALLEQSMKGAKAPDQNGAVDDELRFPSPRTIHFNGAPVRVAALRYRFQFHEHVQEMVVSESGVAEMLFRNVTGAEAGQGRVFFDKDFRAVTFDERGHVVPVSRSQRLP